MARDIKAIQCPHCGSIYKTEVKPDFYRCQNCGTEYFLDSDDVHIYHHNGRTPPPAYSSAPPVNTNLPVYILIGAVLFIAVTYFAVMLFQPKSRNNYAVQSNYKVPRSYHTSFVYTNTATGAPVYLRLGTDYVDKGNNQSDLEVHAQFNNALNGDLLADRVMPKDGQRNNNCDLTFKTYKPDLIMAIGCSNILFEVDTRNNRLNDITTQIFKDYPQLNSGIARLEFDYYKDMITVMNNEGNSYYYFPVIKKLVGTTEQAEAVWKQQLNRHYFEFGYLGDDFDQNKHNQLIEVRYLEQGEHKIGRDLTPGRKYFSPAIIYQDDTNVLVCVNTTAAPSPPKSVQSIDVQTGKIKWTLPPDDYDLYTVAKCKQGFAIEYRKGEEADYVHGVLVVSNTGKLVHNYQLGRTE
ncbi:hypothetical protein [Mucilaginibacter sp.]